METEKKKGIFGKLVNSFVETDEDVPVRPLRSPPKGMPLAQQSAPITIPTAPAFVPQPSGVEKFVVILRQGLEERALSTYDYLKFSKGVTALKSVVFDEASRYKAAFVTANSMGVTKAALLDSTKHYLAALAEEKKQFEGKLSQENESRIGGGQTDLTNIDAQLQSKQAEVQRLQGEIVSLASKRTELSSRIEQDKSLFNQTQASFQSALLTLETEINSDAQKIATFITE